MSEQPDLVAGRSAGELVAMDRRSGMKTIWAALLLAGLLVTPARAETVTYLHTDLLGSVVLETDQNRNVVQRYEYEPYGLPRQAVVDQPGYTGHVHDAGSGLVYMQQRYYDPEVGRFLSVDPVGVDTGTGGNFNRYWYANNNPYRYADPDGRLPILVILIAKEAASEAVEQLTGVPMPTLKNAGKLVARKVVREGGEEGAKNIGQRAATREAKREAGIPTSQQAVSQSNGRAPDGTPVGRQQSYEVPKPGGGTETKSVQISRDTVGDHAGVPQVEAGTVKPGGQVDVAGRPRIQNEGKVRKDFDPKR
jgi:RHS repeat-associated protein